MSAKLQIVSMALGALLVTIAVGAAVARKADAQPMASNLVAQPMVSVRSTNGPTGYLPDQFDMKKAQRVDNTVESF